MRGRILVSGDDLAQDCSFHVRQAVVREELSVGIAPVSSAPESPTSGDSCRDTAADGWSGKRVMKRTSATRGAWTNSSTTGLTSMPPTKKGSTCPLTARSAKLMAAEASFESKPNTVAT